MLHNFIINMRSQVAMLYYTKIITHCYVVQFHNLNVFYIYSYTMYVYLYILRVLLLPNQTPASPLLQCPCRHHGPRHQCNVSRAVMRSSNNLLRVKIVSYGHLASASDVILVTCVFCVMPQATTNN